MNIFPSERKPNPELFESFGSWQLRKDILYLDHGAFGACPTEIAREREDHCQLIEENPHDFFERSYSQSWETAREALACFVNARKSGLVLLPGATYGLNVVIQSLSFNKGEHILVTNHAYSSVRLALDYIARRDSARITVVDVPLIVDSPLAILERILSHITDKTRFAVIDHVPSRTGLLFPIREIVCELEARNIDTLVDGAHAPGMIPLNLSDINAAYYVANCHKWMCSPRGVGFLHVRHDRRQNIKPLVIARSPHVIDKDLRSELEHNFTWLGTSDPSSFMTLPSCIQFLQAVVPGGHEGLCKRNHKVAVVARNIICGMLGVPVPCPSGMIGAMATIPIPDSPGAKVEGMLPLQQVLWKRHRILVPVYSWPEYPKRVVRISVQAYNTLEQYIQFADCLHIALEQEKSQIPRSFPFPSWQSARAWVDQQHASKSVPYFSSLWQTPAINPDSWSADSVTTFATPYQDVLQPTKLLLFRLSQERIRKTADKSFSSYPVALYPAGLSADAGCSASHANLEISSMAHMLTCVGRRAVPKVAACTILQLLEGSNVLEAWPDAVTGLKAQSQTLIKAIIRDTGALRTPSNYPKNKEEFVSRIVPYETELGDGSVGKRLWLLALSELTDNHHDWSLDRIKSFIEIHSFLKDPVGGLRSDRTAQARIFLALVDRIRHEASSGDLSTDIWKEVVAQLALESSYLVHFIDKDAAYVHFCEDQQLVYTYVDIDSLGHSEFSCPTIVIDMMQNMLDVNCGEAYCMVPVAIAYCYPICYSVEDCQRPVIVDGNNRIASILFLRFVSIHGLADTIESNEEALRQHCRDYGLGPVSFIDMWATLEALSTRRAGTLERVKNCAQLHSFRDIGQIPALVTEESSYFTAVKNDKESECLQPVQQSIFACDELLVALPSKGQLHGRTKGYQHLPILRRPRSSC